ncbi:MAG TPA: fluoride efflux transporter CrcB [Methylibium sp.]|uniref:fluoride efflux transporter CrcB n=1 Tax=Methylibium sp. TaxID=2067992 RepID=UPI002DB7B6D2|nr:fluoride efflux transporter CrcB [Methylibium sp.]HEU4460776.1 fluoride efflux transporter CrcB [Methylibium sp.]
MPSATLAQAACVALGAALGALLRWGLGLWLNPLWTSGFPLGTLAVNTAGGFLVGASTAWLAQHPSPLLHLLLVTGFLGGLTTFSAFSIESLELLHRGQIATALLHSAMHLLGALACAALGFALGHGLIGPRG